MGEAKWRSCWSGLLLMVHSSRVSPEQRRKKLLLELNEPLSVYFHQFQPLAFDDSRLLAYFPDEPLMLSWAPKKSCPTTWSFNLRNSLPSTELSVSLYFPLCVRVWVGETETERDREAERVVFEEMVLRLRRSWKKITTGCQRSPWFLLSSWLFSLCRRILSYFL